MKSQKRQLIQNLVLVWTRHHQHSRYLNQLMIQGLRPLMIQRLHLVDRLHRKSFQILQGQIVHPK